VNWEDVWDVLKWVLAALAAGFIGQFGRSFALHVIRRRRATRSEQPSGPSPITPEAQLDRDRLEALAKIEKKRAKAEVKRIKKSGDRAPDA